MLIYADIICNRDKEFQYKLWVMVKRLGQLRQCYLRSMPGMMVLEGRGRGFTAQQSDRVPPIIGLTVELSIDAIDGPWSLPMRHHLGCWNNNPLPISGT
jgi:hypothetical protein